MKDLLTTYAEVQPDKLAIVDDRPDGTLIQWTYADLEARANQLGRVLVGLGLEPGQKLVWCGQNSVYVVLVGQACRKIGVTAVPLNYRLSEEESAYVIDNSDAKVVFADTEYAEKFHKIRKDIPNVENIIIFDGKPGPEMLSFDDLTQGVDSSELDIGLEEGQQGRSMIYTSGTTGKPKGAVRNGIGDPNQMAKMIEVYRATSNDVYLTTGPLYHSGPGGFLAVAYLLGQTAIVQRKFDPEDWLRLVDKYKVSSTFAAPTPIRRIVHLPDSAFDQYDVSSMRIMVANAAPWSFALKKEYLARFPAESLFEVYGSTELGVNTILEPEYQLSKPGSCGKPAPGVVIKLYTDDGKEVTTPREPGELYVQSASVFSTYHKAHEKYMEDRRGEMQTVGDIAYFDEDGFYYICDRKKDMIISGGVNIYPAGIEAALEEHPDIAEAAVFGIPSEEWGESVHAVVVLRPGSSLSAAEVEAHAREHLAGYEVPRTIEFADELPKTGSGKILKRELRAPYWKDHQQAV